MSKTLAAKSINYSVDKEGQNLSILKRVSVQSLAGKTLGLIGRSGCGKSTLLRCLNGVIQPQAGTISIDGTPVNQKDWQQVRQGIGVIFQHYNLLHTASVIDNILLPIKLHRSTTNDDRKQADQLIDWLELRPFAQQRSSHLSGGQQQRVAIARALITRPWLLLCDEPTSALDTQCTQETLRLLTHIQHELNLSCILVSHEMSVIRHLADEVAIMEGGSIVEQKPTLQLMTSPDTAAAKAFIAQDPSHQTPRHLIGQLSQNATGKNTTLLKLLFMHRNSSQPIISEACQLFAVPMSIVQAQVESIQGRTVGILWVTIPSNPSINKKVIDHLKKQHVHVQEACMCGCMQRT